MRQKGGQPQNRIAQQCGDNRPHATGKIRQHHHPQTLRLLDQVDFSIHQYRRGDPGHLEIGCRQDAALDLARRRYQIKGEPLGKDIPKIERQTARQGLQTHDAQQFADTGISFQKLPFLDPQRDITGQARIVDRQRRALPGHVALKPATGIAHRPGKAKTIQQLAGIVGLEREVERQPAPDIAGAPRPPGAGTCQHAVGIGQVQALNAPFITRVDGHQLEFSELSLAHIEGINHDIDSRHFLRDAIHGRIVTRLLTRQIGRDIQILQASGKAAIVTSATGLKCQVAIGFLGSKGRRPGTSLLRDPEPYLRQSLAEQIEHLCFQIGLHRHEGRQAWRRRGGRCLPLGHQGAGQAAIEQTGLDLLDIDAGRCDIQGQSGTRQRRQCVSNRHGAACEAHLPALETPLHARIQYPSDADRQFIIVACAWQRGFGQAQRPGIGRDLRERRRQVDGDAGEIRLHSQVAGFLAHVDRRAPACTA